MRIQVRRIRSPQSQIGINNDGPTRGRGDYNPNNGPEQQSKPRQTHMGPSLFALVSRWFGAGMYEKRGAGGGGLERKILCTNVRPNQYFLL